MPKHLSMERSGISTAPPAEHELEQLLRTKAKEIYSIMTKRDIRRAQPTDANRVEDAIFDSLKDRRRVEFTVLWGGFKEGPTGKADEYDAMALDRIDAVAKEIQAVLNTIPEYNKRTHMAAGFPEGRWTRERWFIDEYYVRPNILFCDMHHRLASGVADERCLMYFDSIETEAHKRSIGIERLSRHYAHEYGQKQANLPWYVKIMSWFSFTPSECEFYSTFNTESITRRCDELCKDAKFMSELLPMAMRHSKLYRKGMSLTSVAKAYIEVELGFLEFMKRELGPDHIFISYSKPCVQGPMFGDIPSVYWYATKRGDSRVPCFMHDGEETSRSDSAQADRIDERPGLNYRKYMFIKRAIKFVLAASLNVSAMFYLSGNYAIPYTLLAGTAVAGGVTNMNAEWRSFRDKYYMDQHAKPKWKEFDRIGATTGLQIEQTCFAIHIPIPEYVVTADKNYDKLLSVGDAKSDKAKQLIAESEKMLGTSADGHEERVMPMFRDNAGGAMSLLLNAHETEPDSVEIMARIAKAAEALGNPDTSRFWLIMANAAYLGMLK